MPILSDRWIREAATTRGMIEPFVEKQTREGVISYGLSSYGYDARVGRRVQDLHQCRQRGGRSQGLLGRRASSTARPTSASCRPTASPSPRTIEYFRMPRDVLVICLGKSTYARCGIIVNVTPLEPEWEGHVTIEISNTTPLPARDLCQRGDLPVPVPQGRRALRDLLRRPQGQIHAPARRDAAAAMTNFAIIAG